MAEQLPVTIQDVIPGKAEHPIECPDCSGDGYHETCCALCAGSGEGMADGTTCHACRGSGAGGTECETCEGEAQVSWPVALAYYWEKGQDLSERWESEAAQAVLELDAITANVILQALHIEGYLEQDTDGFRVAEKRLRVKQ